MFSKNKVHLNCSFLQGLRNQEFPQVFKEICSIYDEEEIDESYVKESLVNLIAHEGDLDFVMETRNPHPLTEVLSNQSKMRKNYLVSLRGRVRTTLKSPIEAERVAAKTLYLWLNKHRRYIYNPSFTLQTRLVDNLMTEYSLKLEVQEALTTLGLSNAFDVIVAITSEIVATLKIRDDEHAANVLKVKTIRDEAYASMVKFLKSLDTAVSLEADGETFYSDYKRKVHVRFDRFKTYLATRTTRSKNAALKNSEEEVFEMSKLFFDDGNPDKTENHIHVDESSTNDTVEIGNQVVMNGSDQISRNQV